MFLRERPLRHNSRKKYKKIEKTTNLMLCNKYLDIFSAKYIYMKASYFIFRRKNQI